MDAELLRKYVERQGDGCFAATRPSESKRRLPEAARDVYALLRQFREGEAAALESFQLLERVFEEQCEITNDPAVPVAVRPPCISNCHGVINPADPDARYNKHKGTGYLVQIMETFVEDDSSSQNTESAPDSKESEPPQPDLITHVAVDPLTMHDQDALEPALDDTEARHIKPKALLADSHYGSNACLAKGRRREVEIVSPAMPAKGTKQGKLTLEDFELDDEGRALSCPAGHPPVETSVAAVRLQVQFDSIGG
ncbi:MAG: hypothetical protein M3552_22270 [Planctomycetota bacterium]|nr:hypothetical protein [Planctomycetota bacterium]